MILEGVPLYLVNGLAVALVLGRLGPLAARRPVLGAGLVGGLFLLDLCAVLWQDFRLLGLVAALVGFVLASVRLPEAWSRPYTEALGPDRFRLYLLSVLVGAGLVLLVLPITTFVTSPSELNIHLGFLFTHNLTRVAAAGWAGAALYGMVMASRARTVLTLAAVAGAATLLIYAFALPFGYPMMNGLVFEQIPVPPEEQALRALADLLVVALVFAGTGAALRRVRGRGLLLALLLVAVSLSLTAGTKVMGALGSAEAEEGELRTSAQPLRFSREHPNVLLLFLDRYMGGYVEEVLAQEPDLAARLEGFTWYPRTVAAGENSIAGLHPLLGGYDYTPDAMNQRGKELRDLSVEAFSILPHNFTKAGWAANFVNPRGLGFTMEGDCAFFQVPGLECSSMDAGLAAAAAARFGLPLSELSRAHYSDLLVLLGAMRATPYAMKGLLGDRGPWRQFLDHSAGTTLKQWAELEALPRLTRTDADRASLNIVFNMLPHEPYFVGEDCLPKQESIDISEKEGRARGYASVFDYQHANAARCVLRMVADYLDWMKQAGIYDNTRIALVSDHGILGPVTDRSSRAAAGGTQANTYVRSRSLLMVKPRESHGPLAVSEEFLPNAELPRILCEEIGGCVNPYLDGRPIETAGRNDPFVVTIVPWQFSQQEPTAFHVREQWVLEGKDPYAAAGWKQVK